MSVRLTPEAAADLREIFEWCSEREASLGLEFLAAFAEVSRRIDEFPENAAEIEAGIRRAPLRRFPYFVFLFPRRNGAGRTRLLSRTPRPPGVASAWERVTHTAL